MFSRITSQLHGERNPLYRVRDELKSRDIPISDLISANITEYGIAFPQTLLESALLRASRKCRIYRPDSFGHLPAREAISAYYAEHGVSIPAGQLVLTPGTSISYLYCFKLLADEGDEILCPTPSYPLFDYIAALSGVRLASYPLVEGARWSIDLARLDACISTRTRALVLISPHNPTGHVASEYEINELAEVALRHDIAIISDEVFSEFLFTGNVLPRPAMSRAPLVFTLNGFSKMFALPGMKLGWIGITGHPDRVGQAMGALELISDTFLPVNEVIQAAAPEIMKEGGSFLASYCNQVRERRRLAEKILGVCSCCEFALPEGGFYVTLCLKGLDEEQTCVDLLRREHLLLHPGYFYDIKPHHLVLAFIQQPDTLRETFSRLVACLEQMQRGSAET